MYIIILLTCILHIGILVRHIGHFVTCVSNIEFLDEKFEKTVYD